MELSPCMPAKPLIELGGGDAPVLDYSMPQKTCFSVYGMIPVQVNQSHFKKVASAPPEEHFWARFEGMSKAEILGGLRAMVEDGQYTAEIFRRPLVPVTENPAGGAREVRAAATHDVRATMADLDLDGMAGAIAEGYRPVLTRTFGGTENVRMMKQPTSPVPRIYIMEEYRVCSWLGDYGAGKTVKTFTLLPGERTTISVRTYMDRESTRSRSENILDSFTEHSANEFERTLQQENGEQVTNQMGGSAGGHTTLSVSAPIAGVEAGAEAGSEHEFNASRTRVVNARTIDTAVAKHVESSTQTREVEVNTSTSTTVSAGEETTITREITNINRSRVLNFVFRQLLQEYITLTWLHDVRFVFTNGYPESTRVIDLPELEAFLLSFLTTAQVKPVLATLLKEYCKVYNYDDQRFSFIERRVEDYGDCPFAGADETVAYWRKRRDLRDSYEGIEVPGVILKASRHILPTTSIIGDALLGQGEALDCYNISLQNAAVNAADLRNAREELGQDIIGQIEEPDAKADAYVDMFRPAVEPAETGTAADEEA